MNKRAQIRARRRPARGGYARGEEARSRIIGVAIEAFGKHGFEGASTRTIAEMAGVSAPALQYYFGGKRGLYLACAEYIATIIGLRLACTLISAQDTLARKSCSRKALILKLHDLLSEILDMLLQSDMTEAWTLFAAREQAHPTAAFEAIFESTQGPVIQLCAALIARLSNLSEDDPQVTIFALSLYGQITSFRFGHASVLRVLDAREISRAHLAEIKSVLYRQLACFSDQRRH